MTPTVFYFDYGLRIDDATEHGAPSKFRNRLREILLQEKERVGYSFFGFGWSWWQKHWDLDREQRCLRLYAKTGSVRKTAERMNCFSIEVACLAQSVDRLLPDHEHKFRGSKICTFSVLEKAKALAKKGFNRNEMCAKLGVKGTWLKMGLRGTQLDTKMRCAWGTEEQKALAISLYERGVVPKDMHKHGVTAGWPAIYKWIRAAGCTPLRKNLRRELRLQYASDKFPEEKWKIYSRLVRKLTADTFREHRDEIDPDHLRGTEWHLDHKTSIFKAFAKGWSPERAASKRNLQMLPAIENRRKFVF